MHFRHLYPSFLNESYIYNLNKDGVALTPVFKYLFNEYLAILVVDKL
jgi:hypothetical protein